MTIDHYIFANNTTPNQDILFKNLTLSLRKTDSLKNIKKILDLGADPYYCPNNDGNCAFTYLLKILNSQNVNPKYSLEDKIQFVRLFSTKWNKKDLITLSDDFLWADSNDKNNEILKILIEHGFNFEFQTKLSDTNTIEFDKHPFIAFLDQYLVDISKYNYTQIDQDYVYNKLKFITDINPQIVNSYIKHDNLSQMADLFGNSPIIHCLSYYCLSFSTKSAINHLMNLGTSNQDVQRVEMIDTLFNNIFNLLVQNNCNYLNTDSQSNSLLHILMISPLLTFNTANKILKLLHDTSPNIIHKINYFGYSPIEYRMENPHGFISLNDQRYFASYIENCSNLLNDKSLHSIIEKIELNNNTAEQHNRIKNPYYI